MKNIFALGIMLLMSYSNKAQVAPPERILSEKVIELPGISKEDAFTSIKNYVEQVPSSFYFNNDAIDGKNRDWALGRAKFRDKDIHDPGLIDANENDKVINISTIFIYQAAHENAFALVTVYAIMEVRLKDGKMRIAFKDVRYTNKTPYGSPPSFQKIYSPGRPQCANAGSYDQLLDCQASPPTVRNIDAFVRRAMSTVETDILKAGLTKAQSANSSGQNDNW